MGSNPVSDMASAAREAMSLEKKSNSVGTKVWRRFSVSRGERDRDEEHGEAGNMRTMSPSGAGAGAGDMKNKNKDDKGGGRPGSSNFGYASFAHSFANYMHRGSSISSIETPTKSEETSEEFAAMNLLNPLAHFDIKDEYIFNGGGPTKTYMPVMPRDPGIELTR